MSTNNISNLMSPNRFEKLMQDARTPSLDGSSNDCVTFGEVTPSPIERTDDIIVGSKFDISNDHLLTPEQTPIKKDDDSHLREELYFIFTKLEKFMKKDDEVVLGYTKVKKSVLKHRIDLLSSNMTCLKNGYTKYEELYQRIVQRLSQENFAGYFD